MRLRSLIWLTLVLGFSAYATPLFTDPYAGQNPGLATNNGDVIGQLRLFDIESVEFTSVNAANVTAVIRVNYNNGDTTLGGFTVGNYPTLHIGDLLFTAGDQRWGVALSAHSGFSAGALYQVSAFRTASDVLGIPPSGNYRPNEFVWMNANGADDVGGGTVTTASVGGSEVQITLNFKPDQNFLNAFGGMQVHFAAATCANDILDGQVPEPLTALLIGSGLAGIGLIRRRRRAN